MPPHRHPRHHRDRHRRHVPSSDIVRFIDPARVDALLARWVPEPEERAFVVRCLLEEGPAHHRGANYILLALLQELLSRQEAASDGVPAAPARRGDDLDIAVPLRLPPHLADETDEADFPLRMPSAPLERLAERGSARFDAMVDCLTDGPPQHALANAAMVCILGRLLELGAPREGAAEAPSSDAPSGGRDPERGPDRA